MTMFAVEAPSAGQASLVDLLDRLLGAGVVITGDIVISVADVDLVRISLHALLATVEDVVSTAAAEGRT